MAIQYTLFFRLSTLHTCPHSWDGRRSSWGWSGRCDSAEKGGHPASLRSAQEDLSIAARAAPWFSGITKLCSPVPSEKVLAEMLDFRRTWWPLPYVALMTTTYWAVFLPVTVKRYRCWSPVCSCHRVKLSLEYSIQGKAHEMISNCTPGSTTVLVVPLTSIAEEVHQECQRLGIRAVVGSQVTSKWNSNFSLDPVLQCYSVKLNLNSSLLQLDPEEFKTVMQGQPQLVICSVEFLASREVCSYDSYGKLLCILEPSLQHQILHKCYHPPPLQQTRFQQYIYRWKTSSLISPSHHLGHGPLFASTNARFEL